MPGNKAVQLFEYQISNDIFLRQLQDHDASALFALTDANRAYLRQWLPWLDANVSVEDTNQFIQQASQRSAKTGAFVAGIWYESQLCGVIGHNRIDQSNRIAYPGYWLGESFQGNGIMTKCCRALTHCTLNDMGLNKVVITVATGNVRSQAIPRRLGYQLEGTLRDAEWLYDHYVDHHVYAVVKREWTGGPVSPGTTGS